MATIKSIEEKAKAYDEALERAKIWQNHLYEIGDKDYADELNYIFPELAESDDERIRKAIICGMHALKDQHKTCFASIPIDNVIDWLEKQVHSDFRSKIYVSDKVTRTPSFDEAQGTPIIKQCEQEEMDYNEELKKCKANPLYFFDKYVNVKLKEQKQEWSEEDEITRNALINLVEMYYGGCIDKSEKNRLLNFLKSLKDRVLPQPRQEWSEEDEIHQLHTISLIEDIKDWANKDGMHSLCIERCIESIDWLILLKERCCPQIGDYHEGFKKGFAKAKAMNCHWKPSDEQIEALDTIINHVVTKTSYFDALEDLNYRNLEKLYNDLKKLKG